MRPHRQSPDRSRNRRFRPHLESLEGRSLLAAGPVMGPQGVQIIGDFSGFEGSPLAFRGTFHDSPASAAQFLWRVLDADRSVIAQGDQRDFSFVPSNEGTYQLILAVTDSGTSTQTVPLAIANDPPPIIQQLTATKTDLDRQITLSATIADPGPGDQPARHWQIIEQRTGLVIKQSDQETYSLKLRHRGGYTAVLTVVDEAGAATTASTTFAIGNVTLPMATDNQYFVGQIYVELLHRQVDAEGLAYERDAGLRRIARECDSRD